MRTSFDEKWISPKFCAERRRGWPTTEHLARRDHGADSRRLRRWQVVIRDCEQRNTVS
jgi:hypothetical protein